MANAITLTTPNYTQAEKNFFITDSLIGLESLKSGLFYIASDVKNDKYTFPRVTQTIVLQPITAIPSSAGSVTLSNKDVNLGSFMGYAEFLPSIFENHWMQDQISSNLLDRSLPVTFENYLATTYTAANLAPIENQIWMGSTGLTSSNNRFVDGIIKQCLTTETASLKITNTGITVTGATYGIKAQLEAAKNLSPKALMTASDRYTKMKFLVSIEDYYKYEEACVLDPYKNQDTTSAGIPRYKGFDIIALPGLPENTLFFGKFTSGIDSNLHLAVTEMSNMEFKLDKLQANSPLWFYRFDFKYGVGVANPGELVMSTNLTLGSF